MKGRKIKIIDNIKKLIQNMNYKFIMIFKYLLGFLFCLMAYSNKKDINFLFNILIVLLIIFIIQNIISVSLKKCGYVLNTLIYGLFCIQMQVMFYGSRYITMVMLTNIDSIQDLSGHFLQYLLSFVVVAIAIFIPHKSIHIDLKQQYKMLAILLMMELVLTHLLGANNSPYLSYIDLAKEYRNNIKQNEELKNQPNYTAEFYKAGVYDLYASDGYLSDKPNIVLILTEGLSQNIIEDERDIMPNVRKYEKKSLNFVNYFNHTFPTYRGIIGQLYSGYQLDNYDINTLVSIQSIFNDEGYNTIFINTEPQNIDFTMYLNQLGFNEVITNYDQKYNGAVETISDKEAYQLLFDEMKAKSEDDKPYFIVIYTFGTHASLDSPDKKYGDGTDQELNKFYNMDYYFGKFMKKWEKNKITDNTVLVFSTDHATYADMSFNQAFPDYYRINEEIDKVPFFIYHKSMVSGEIDAAGRNSLDLVPTVLDYVNISGENYFLGETLFMVKDNNNGFDTSFCDGYNIMDTTDGEISEMSTVKREIFEERLNRYYSAKFQEPLQ